MTSDLAHILDRGVADVISREGMAGLLATGRPLRLKLGFDPSFPDIHLGHVVALRKLRQFQALGHRVVLIVGDWTAQIGDPSGRSATRPMLTPEQVRANAATYMEQFFRVVDRDRTEVRWQSEWYGSFGLADLLRLTSRFTVAQMLAREEFTRRHAEGHPIALTELLYPLLQAYDSVAIEADVEFGGTDQRFNCLVGRELQGALGMAPQQIVLVPLLVGTDGAQKMSKSLGNYIAIASPPDEIYGRTMSLADPLIPAYFELLTDLSDQELEGVRHGLADGSQHPMEAKKRLAALLVEQFHGSTAARTAGDEFERVFQRGQAPQEAPVIAIPDEDPVDLSDLLAKGALAPSKAAAKRLIAQGGVEINGVRLSSPSVRRASLPDGALLRVGKHRFARLRVPSF
ncbi:MAG: tyrosine--tRNA ligase [Chloroflexi bacterium]|nr:tyrosine--tRNA ligase [Chloroflexota bacterium]